MTERHLKVQRTARYHQLGDPATARAIWIVVHGYGQLARYFLNSFTDLAVDRTIIAPEGLNRFYTDEAHQRVGATWMTREDREHEIADHVAYLDALHTSIVLEVGDLPLGVLGFSQGVATACRWSFQGRSTIHRLVLWAGGLPPEPDPEQLHAAWSKVDLHVVLGTRDPYASDKELQQQGARLRMANVPHQVHRFQGGHELEQVLLFRLLRS